MRVWMSIQITTHRTFCWPACRPERARIKSRTTWLFPRATMTLKTLHPSKKYSKINSSNNCHNLRKKMVACGSKCVLILINERSDEHGILSIIKYIVLSRHSAHLVKRNLWYSRFIHYVHRKCIEICKYRINTVFFFSNLALTILRD